MLIGFFITFKKQIVLINKAFISEPLLIKKEVIRYLNSEAALGWFPGAWATSEKKKKKEV